MSPDVLEPSPIVVRSLQQMAAVLHWAARPVLPEGDTEPGAKK